MIRLRWVLEARPPETEAMTYGDAIVGMETSDEGPERMDSMYVVCVFLVHEPNQSNSPPHPVRSLLGPQLILFSHESYLGPGVPGDNIPPGDSREQQASPESEDPWAQLTAQFSRTLRLGPKSHMQNHTQKCIRRGLLRGTPFVSQENSEGGRRILAWRWGFLSTHLNFWGKDHWKIGCKYRLFLGPPLPQSGTTLKILSRDSLTVDTRAVDSSGQ